MTVQEIMADGIGWILQRNIALRRQYNLFKTFSNWWVYYAEKLGLLTSSSLLFITRKGVTIIVPKQLYPEFKSIFLRQHYLEGLSLPLPEHPTIIDIGANIGFFSLFAASEWEGGVFAYEPVQANYEALLRNVELNKQVTVNCRHMAVAGISGILEIYYEDSATLTTTASAYKSGAQCDKKEKVKAVTLLEIFESEGLRKVDLLKMDCEGSEFQILFQTNPETLRRISQMAVEVHGNCDVYNHNAEALRQFLTTVGFAVHTNHRGTYLWARRIDKAEGNEGTS